MILTVKNHTLDTPEWRHTRVKQAEVNRVITQLSENTEYDYSIKVVPEAPELLMHEVVVQPDSDGETSQPR